MVRGPSCIWLNTKQMIAHFQNPRMQARHKVIMKVSLIGSTPTNN